MRGKRYGRAIGVYILDPNDWDDLRGDGLLLLLKWLSFSVEQETIPFTSKGLNRSPAGVEFVPVGFFIKTVSKVAVNFVEAEDEEHPEDEDLDNP